MTGFELLLSKTGKGTETLISLEDKAEVEVIAHLGKPALISGDNIAYIAGGIGIAGFFQFVKDYTGRINKLYFGTTTAWKNKFYELLKSSHITISSSSFEDYLEQESFFMDTIEPRNKNAFIITDDGTYEQEGKGFITDLLTDLDCDAAIACGPPAMLKRVHEITAAAEIPAYGSFEARMACGVGACRGCAIPVRPEKTGGKEYLMVCEDGPVFDMDVIDWERYRAAEI